MKQRLLRLRDDLGLMGTASLVLLAAAGLFFILVLKPLQQRSDALQAALSRHAAKTSGGQADRVSDKLAAVYGFLDKEEETTDWLARLYAIGRATGVEVKSANYRTQQAGARLERYEIVLPVAGSYAQIRDFLKRALADIPVLSLDQMTLKRESRNDGVVRAELRLTLHRVKS